MILAYLGISLFDRGKKTRETNINLIKQCWYPKRNNENVEIVYKRSIIFLVLLSTLTFQGTLCIWIFNDSKTHLLS
ncbi:hypothetical protein BD408DRAFT_413359 [Parasitella parasitica]|nr:hypothetical protein BD408DRAFT_413359 [Parasitella parasitica]